MPLTKKLLDEIAADMAAEQAYYKWLHALIEHAKHTGGPIPQVRPFPGRATPAYAGFHPAELMALPAQPRFAAAGGPAWAARNGAPSRGGWARTHLRSLGQAIGRVLNPFKRRGPVL